LAKIWQLEFGVGRIAYTIGAGKRITNGRIFEAFALLCDASAPDQLCASHFDLEARPWATRSVVAHLYWRLKVLRSPLYLSISFSLSFSLSISPYFCLSLSIHRRRIALDIACVSVSAFMEINYWKWRVLHNHFGYKSISAAWFNQIENRPNQVFETKCEMIAGKLSRWFCWINKNLNSLLYFCLIVQSGCSDFLVCVCVCIPVSKCVSVCVSVCNSPRENNKCGL